MRTQLGAYFCWREKCKRFYERQNGSCSGNLNAPTCRRIGMRYRYTYRELVQPKNQLVTFRLYQLNLDGREERVYQKYWNASAVHFVEAGL